MTKGACFQCEAENPPDQSFCGRCGASLVLKDFISGQVSKELAAAVRDRNTVETESAIRVFEKAWGWANTVTKVFLAPVAIVLLLLGWLGWKEFDLSKTAQTAKEQIENTAGTARSEISQTSTKSIGEVQKESGKAIEANRDSAAAAVRLSNDVKLTASNTTNELKNEATSVRTEVAKSESELESVHKLQPEFDSMRDQLTHATNELAAQQKTISSSEDFVKQVFSNHVSYGYQFNQQIQPNGYVVIPSSTPGQNTIVLMLLPESPIDGTIEMQFGFAIQPPGSYSHIHNLLIYYWGQPPESLKNGQLFVSMFPDKTDTDKFTTLDFHDGRAFVDGQPLPKFGVPDPDFKGVWPPIAKKK